MKKSPRHFRHLNKKTQYDSKTKSFSLECQVFAKFWNCDVSHLSSILAAPVQIRCVGTEVHVFAISTIASASRRPKPNLWLKWNPAPFVRQPSSTGLVSLAVLTMICCMSRQVSLLLRKIYIKSINKKRYEKKKWKNRVLFTRVWENQNQSNHNLSQSKRRLTSSLAN